MLRLVSFWVTSDILLRCVRSLVALRPVSSCVASGLSTLPHVFLVVESGSLVENLWCNPPGS